MPKSVAVIHLRPPVVGESPFLGPVGTLKLVSDGLRFEHGIPTFFSRGLKAWGDEEVSVWDPQQGEQITLTLGRVGVVLDHNGALSKSDIAASLTMLNGRQVRAYDDKAYAAESGVYADWMVPTFAISPSSLLEDVTEQGSGRPLFLKPTKGFASAGVMRTDRISLESALADIKRLDKEYVGQPIIDNSLPFPSEIKFEGEESKNLARERKSLPKELRIFWSFGRSETGGSSLSWLPVARLSGIEEYDEQGRLKLNDKYAYVDRTTVPKEIIEATQRFSMAISVQSGQNEMSGAYDFMYGIVNGEEPRWWVGEGNFWQPVPPKRFDLKKEFAAAMTSQIVRMMRKREQEDM